MKNPPRAILRVAIGAVLMAVLPRDALGVGEGVNGFPNWAERVEHEWMNRARSDPQVEMAACGGAKCPDGACYLPVAPLAWDVRLNRSARFHSDEMAQQGYFAHDSTCTLVSNIDSLYPASCNGAASCACVGGTGGCPCTTWSGRISLFGLGGGGEIIASSVNPNTAFYQWLFESYTKSTCAYDQGPPTNGHRWNILKSGGRVGFGVGSTSVGDFGGAALAQKIPSGSHYPRQAASIEAWANWYDAAGPKAAVVDVDGTCQPLALSRGSATNGAWMATLTGLASGCHRYVFSFTDSNDNVVTYPTTGSLGLGPVGCADWDVTRPASGTGCGTCTPSCALNACGGDGCSGTCGPCASSETCLSNVCVPNAGTGGTPGTGGTTASGGTAATGGTATSGGTTSSTGGTLASGGTRSAGGVSGASGGATGGAAGSNGSGASPAGGASSGAGGTAGRSTGAAGGIAMGGPDAGAASDASHDSNGCGCRVPATGGSEGSAGGGALATMAILALGRRRARRSSAG